MVIVFNLISLKKLIINVSQVTSMAIRLTNEECLQTVISKNLREANVQPAHNDTSV